jgi:hypothetical protein
MPVGINPTAREQEREDTLGGKNVRSHTRKRGETLEPPARSTSMRLGVVTVRNEPVRKRTSASGQLRHRAVVERACAAESASCRASSPAALFRLSQRRHAARTRRFGENPRRRQGRPSRVLPPRAPTVELGTGFEPVTARLTVWCSVPCLTKSALEPLSEHTDSNPTRCPVRRGTDPANRASLKRDAGGSRTRVRLLCRQPPNRLASASSHLPS